MLSTAAECREETLKQGEMRGKEKKKTALVKEESEYKNITTTMHY